MNTLLLVGLLALAWLALRVVVLRGAGGVGRAVRCAWLPMVFGVVIWAGFASLHEDSAGPLGLLAAMLIGDAVLGVPGIRRLVGPPPEKRTREWLARFAGGIVAATVVLGAGGVCLGAAYVPNSSMSPNLRGHHTVTSLEDGNHLVVAANDPDDPNGIAAGDPTGAIVAETYEYRTDRRPAKPTHPADRFVWNKTIVPRRWDAVVFSYPARPGEKFVKRLVGLPGERVEIRDGAVWSNGERLMPPSRLGPIRYSAGLDPSGIGTWELGPGEFFLLGDNTDHCSDSRLRGPVPAHLIDGVVEAIYWPPSRWRLNP